MPAGRMKRVYRRKRKLPTRPTYKKKRYLPKRKNFRKSQIGLRAQAPITRRKLKMTCLHQYQNNMHVNIPNWAAFQQAGHANLDVSLVQSYNLSSPQIFDTGGKTGVMTGNGPGYVTYGKTVTDIWSQTGAATMIPGYASYPVASDQFNHIQVLGTETTFKIRCINPSVPGTQLTEIPIKVLLVPTSDSAQGTSALTTEEWEAMPYVQSRILEGTNSQNNNTAFLKYTHSNRKFNGIPKGQYLGDNRYLASSTTNQTAGSGGNVASEQEHLKLVFAPLSSNFSGGLAASIVPPNLFIEMRVKRWIRYTDPNNSNETFGTGETTEL